ncbi:glycosyltransferase family 2 protein [Lactobacillus intestinalis]|uniref:Glycosyl transferase family 2 n=1 Tax=Lactobacillus intestinalis DSM 6629 TaxID=1423761 RepID=A0ABR5PNY7_9LACO|nr:glycosyltransferase family A protein [Lactobacillus intestinalis]KRM31306.1 glycosyl transferase family 2 [Lactobacillus intestinalis DSM 6629]UTW40138.1 glycosyltransferase family 2 protein [Lactobacillus intestinalis]
MKTLTISVAAYNVESTLDKTLASFNDPRVYDDLEVLIIDDGSKDNTNQIAKKYENIAPQTFKYIPKKNGGHGSTINKGMELATGKYFKVVDGDDWVDTSSLVKFIEDLKSQDSDLVLTDFTEMYPDQSKNINLIKNVEPAKEYTWKDKIDIKRVVLHTLTVKTNLLRKNNVHITENCFYVDVEFVTWAAYVSQTITYFDLYLYKYRLGEADQSVAKANMLKNIKMQEKVSYQLVKMYDSFTKNNKMLPNQEETIFNTFRRSIGSTMRTYLLMSLGEAKSRTKTFDKNIKRLSLASYQRLNNDNFIRLIRKGNYSMLPLAKVMYRIWVKKYGY